MKSKKFSRDEEMTAGDLMEQLENDPVFVEQRADRVARRNQRQQMLLEDEKPILERLKDAGFEVDSLESIVPKFAPLSDILVEVLLECLYLCRHDRNREWIVRSLGAAKKPFDGRRLVDSYNSTYDEGVRFAVLNTIALIRPHSIAAWLETARRNPRIHTELEKLGYEFQS